MRCVQTNLDRAARGVRGAAFFASLTDTVFAFSWLTGRLWNGKPIQKNEAVGHALASRHPSAGQGATYISQSTWG